MNRIGYCDYCGQPIDDRDTDAVIDCDGLYCSAACQLEDDAEQRAASDYRREVADCDYLD